MIRGTSISPDTCSRALFGSSDLHVMEEATLDQLAAKFGSDSEKEASARPVDAQGPAPPASAPTGDAPAGSADSNASDSDAYYEDDYDSDEEDEELATALDWADMSEGQGRPESPDGAAGGLAPMRQCMTRRACCCRHWALWDKISYLKNSRRGCLPRKACGKGHEYNWCLT